MAVTVIVAYDIAQDRRCAKLAALLQAWGDRIQYSVFLCVIGPEQLKTLQSEIGRIVDVDEDSVFVFRQCRDCWSGLATVGQGEPPTADLYWVAL